MHFLEIQIVKIIEKIRPTTDKISASQKLFDFNFVTTSPALVRVRLASAAVSVDFSQTWKSVELNPSAFGSFWEYGDKAGSGSKDVAARMFFIVGGSEYKHLN